MKKSYVLTANLDYVQGHLRYGHIEATLDEEEFQEFSNLTSEDEKKEYLRECGDILIDDYSINDYGDIGEITIIEHGK